MAAVHDTASERPDPCDREMQRQFALAWPPHEWCQVTTVVAVSGGLDSVALLRLLVACRAGGQLVVGHYNHGWRGREADRDAEFVKRLAGNLGIATVLADAPATVAPESPGSPESEESAREARYDFLVNTAHRVGARYVVTAHTADDQIETVLHRIIRGSGVAGISGIRRARRMSESLTLLRPLLSFRRADLAAYLVELEQPFCEDVTNLDVRRTRNRIRRELLPLLRDGYNGQVDSALLRLAALAGEAQDEIDRLVGQLLPAAVETADERCLVLRVDRLATASPYLRRQLLLTAWRGQQWPLQGMGFPQWDRLSGMLQEATSGSALALPGRVHARRNGDRLTLMRDI